VNIDFDKAFAGKTLPTFQDSLSEHLRSVVTNGYHYAQTTVDSVYAYIQLPEGGEARAELFFGIRDGLYGPADLNDSPLKKKFNTSEEQQERLRKYVDDEVQAIARLFASGSHMKPQEIWTWVTPRREDHQTKFSYNLTGASLPDFDEAVAAWKTEVLEPAPELLPPLPEAASSDF
jgi:hypothetical protein